MKYLRQTICGCQQQGLLIKLLFGAPLILASCTTNITEEQKGPEAWEKIQKHPEELLSQAKSSQALGNTNEALFYFASYLDHDSKNAEVLASVGEIHLEKKNLDLAQVALEMSIASNPNLSRASEGMGRVMMQRGEIDAAKRFFEKAVQLDPSLWRAHNALGLIADRQRRPDMAERSYQAAISANPKNTQVLNNLSYSRFLAGRFESAIETVDRALSINPRLESAILNRALYLVKLNRHDEALESLKTILNEPDAYNNLGFFLMQEGEWTRAREDFEKAIALSPSYHDLAHQNLEKLSWLEQQERHGHGKD